MHPSPDLLALLALGEEAGSAEERAHIQSCAECRAEIADLARAVTAGRGGRAGGPGLVTPPDRVWQSIRAELGFAEGSTPTASAELPDISILVPLPRHADRSETNGVAAAESNGVAAAETNGVTAAEDHHDLATEPTAEPERMATVSQLSDAPSRSSRGRRSLAALVAAAVALVLGVGLGVGLDRLLPRQTVLWTAELQALPSFSGSTGEAKVEEDSAGRRTLVVELNSPEPVDGSRGVWLIDRNTERMRFLGSLNGDRGSLPVPPDLDPHEFPVVDVSKEPPGDPDLAHSGVSIVRGTLDV
jgi:hypothetical protein